MLFALIGSLVVCGLSFYGMYCIDRYELFHEAVAHGLTGQVQYRATDLALHLQEDLRTVASLAVAGVSWTVFDQITAHRLSLHRAIYNEGYNDPDVLRAAVVLGWCLLFSSFVRAFTS